MKHGRLRGEATGRVSRWTRTSRAGTTATLDLGFGVAVLLLVLPAVTGALAWSRSGVQADGSVRD